MKIVDVLKQENVGKRCSMYTQYKNDDNKLSCRRNFNNGLICNRTNEYGDSVIQIVIKGTENFFLEDKYYLYDILRAEFKLEDIYCYVEDFDGGFVCYKEDVKHFPNASVCIEGTKEEIEEYVHIKGDFIDNIIIPVSCFSNKE